MINPPLSQTKPQEYFVLAVFAKKLRMVISIFFVGLLYKTWHIYMKTFQTNLGYQIIIQD